MEAKARDVKMECDNNSCCDKLKCCTIAEKQEDPVEEEDINEIISAFMETCQEFILDSPDDKAWLINELYEIIRTLKYRT